MAKGDKPKKGGQEGGSAQLDKNAPAAILASLPKVIQHDSLHTINHLLQTSVALAIESRTSGNEPSGQILQRCRYVQSLARKATLRMDTSVKRSICRRCGMILLPGITATVRVRGHRSTHMMSITRCRMCGWQRKIPCQPVALQPRFNKFLSQQRARRAQKKLVQKLEGKVAALRVRVEVLPGVHIASADGERIGQRARRRRARALYNAKQKIGMLQHQTKQESEDGTERAQSKGTKRSRPARRRKRRARSEEFDIIAGTEQRRKAKPMPNKRNRKPRKEALVIPMTRFADRIQENIKAGEGDQTSPFFGLTEKNILGFREKKAISLLRGNHVVTRGLGKGGSALILEGQE